MNKNRLVYAGLLMAEALVLKFGLMNFMESENNIWLKLTAVLLIAIIGAGFVLKGTADIIEETTEVLSEKTKIASGVLQSVGTAFPDMALGVVAALVSLRLAKSDFASAVNFAVIAAATTFGSNIYNVGYAIWCILRQNMANDKNEPVLMFPWAKKVGKVTPFSQHKVKPLAREFDVANDIMIALTIVTALVAICMVTFGKVAVKPTDISGDLYQLARPMGIVLFLLSAGLMYKFRKTQKPENPIEEIEKEERFYKNQPIWVVWVSLILAGAAILMAAEAMVKAIEVFSIISGIPAVISGAAAGIIGCLGEILVIHNYTLNPKGRIGDAVVGIAMDNVVTTMGAGVVAMMGGIFLGGNALIVIFVLILALNGILIWQVSKLKNYYVKDAK